MFHKVILTNRKVVFPDQKLTALDLLPYISVDLQDVNNAV